MSRTAALAAFVTMACGVAPTSVSTRQQTIVGGEAVDDGNWPNVVWLDDGPGCTAIVVHPLVVLFAAHCGSSHRRVVAGAELEIQSGPTGLTANGGQAFALERCGLVQNAELGSASDVGFCVLEEPISAPTIPVMMGCESAFVTLGVSAVLVGYGIDDDGLYGVKRYTRAPIAELGPELAIGSAQAGTCDGDSGGPAFTELEAQEGLRLAALLSSGEIGSCGVGWYVPLEQHIPLLEHETQMDLTPCFDADGLWKPTPYCRTPSLDADGFDAGDTRMSSACGPSYEPEPDQQRPWLSLDQMRWDPNMRVLDVQLNAKGIGGSIVELAVFASSKQEPVIRRFDQLPPYDFSVNVPPNLESERFTASVVTATGQRAELTQGLRRADSAACATSGSNHTSRVTWHWALLALVLRRRWARIERT